MLKKKNRTLTYSQWDYLSEQVKVGPTSLYNHLAYRVIVHLTSFQANVAQQGGIRSLIVEILENLQANYGSVTVEAALGFITFAVDGLTDRELVDLLTIYNDVMRSDLFKSNEEGWETWMFHPQLKEGLKR